MILGQTLGFKNTAHIKVSALIEMDLTYGLFIFETLVYTAPKLLKNQEGFRKRIIVECIAIRNNSGIFEKVRQRISHACILTGSNHFQQFLQIKNLEV